MSEAVSAVEACDLLLFCYPVYTFITPYQLQRFIELLKSQNIDLSQKYATQITTSKHFYDFTAHRYIEQNCYDLKLKFIRGLSADMDDLLCERGRSEALAFFKYVSFCVENSIFETCPKNDFDTRPEYVISLENTEKSDGFDTVIVTNATATDTSLTLMIADFEAVYPYKTRVVNIAQYPFSGGCLGCFNCASDGKCVYKDGFDSFLREEIQTANAIVYAFTVKDHSMGASFKLYDDRQFCNGHRTVTMGMPIGYIANGNYADETNLQLIIEGRCEVGHNFLCGVASNAAEIQKLSDRLCFALENKYVQPQNFLGVGGMKIFRDLIYLMRGLMKEDHRFYKQHGMYDFPQKKLGTVIKMKLVGALASSKKLKSKLGNHMNEGMIAPYKKVIDAQ